jgi:6-phosphogluconolactonase
MAQLMVVRDKGQLSSTAADRITGLIESALERGPTAAVSLSGGTTPEELYRLLADASRPWRGRIDWTRVHLFWSDERNVPPNNPESNFGLANRTLIQSLRIPPAQVHRIRGELLAAEAGRQYDALLRSWRAQMNGPLFHVMLLGIGANAHIASLFPGSPLLERFDSQSDGHVGPLSHVDHDESPLLAAGVWVPELNQWRITLTPRALLASNSIVVMASGREKANAVAAALHAPPDVSLYPAQVLRPAGDRVDWIVDEAAAGGLSSPL